MAVNIVYLVLVAALFIVLSIQNSLKQGTSFGKRFVLIYLNLSAVTFAIRPFANSRIWMLCLLCCSAVETALLLIFTFRHVRVPERYPISRVYLAAPGAPILLLLGNMQRQSYLGSQGMWIPVVAAGIILAAVSLFVFIKFFRSYGYFVRQRGEFIAAIFLIILAAFVFPYMTIESVNYALDGKATMVDVEIVDKDISSGVKKLTRFELTVIIDGKEKIIDVPVDVYHSENIVDSVEINLYKGALGYGYHIYEGVGGNGDQ